MFLDKDGLVIPGMSLTSRASSGVPGTVHGLLSAWSDHGSGNIRLQQLLAPAIKLADKGYILSKRRADFYNYNKNIFLQNTAAAKIFIRRDGRPWEQGDLFVQKDLAKTLKRISKSGIDGFYKGITAKLIVKEMERGNGLISEHDLRQYKPVYREPVIGSFKDIEIISMGPPSSGGLLLIHMLNALENFQIDTLGWNSTDYIHLLTEVSKRAYADRAQHLGDPDFSVKPGTPNYWGLVGDKANAIEPNKRPLSSMTPTILMYEGIPIMTIGSPGGSKIITTVLQCILNVLVHDMNIKEAVCAPRIHHQWLPENTIFIEPDGINKDVIKNLQLRGHVVKTYGYMGVANGIIISDDGFYGGGDCRDETSALGY